MASDVAAELVTLLESGAEILQTQGPPEAVRPGHMAVLVRTNVQALNICAALLEAGVPAVTNGSGSVFATEPAADWLRLLEALERPTGRDRAASAALTAFIGWTVEQVAKASDAEWEDLHWLLHQWAAIFRHSGVAALLEHVSASRRLPERLLSRTSGERDLTDLRHVGQLLHAAARAEGLGSTALTAWLRRRIDEAAQDTGDEERSRRLESDAEAVQVLTIHRSKGLEFPVVFCPYLWDFPSRKPQIPMFHDADNGDARTIDVGGEMGPGFAEHCASHLVEERGEDVRLLYVALTRARHQAVLWWAGTWQGRDAPLSRLIFDQDADGVVSSEGSDTPSDAEAIRRFEAIASASGDQISVESVTAGVKKRWAGPVRPSPILTTAVFDRTLDERWRRTSYSGITSASHEARVGSEPEEDVIDDEGVVGPVAVANEGQEAEESLREVALPLAILPGGVHVGTLIHRVLEATDFAAEDLETELRDRLTAELAWRPIGPGRCRCLGSWAQRHDRHPARPLGQRDGTARFRAKRST